MSYRLNSLPTDLATFQALLPALQDSPEGAVAACLAALHLLTHDTEAGKRALTLLHEGVSRTTIQRAERQLAQHPHLPRSYFLGTSPEGGYALPPTLELDLTENPYSGSRDKGQLKLFVACSGADSPRPVTTKRRDDGSWYAHEWSSLVVGIRPPK